MESNFKEKIEGIMEEITLMEKEIDSKRYEIDKLWIENGADFEDSYVEFFTGDTYIYMKVERQIVMPNGAAVSLEGPMVKLDGNPLEDFESVNWGSYSAHDTVCFDAETVRGDSYETIRKITREDMIFVLDTYCRTIKDNLI